MTDDLVTRLTLAADEFIEDSSHGREDAAPVLLRLAADEIERLRALITEWADADNAVTAAADARPFVREQYDVAIERCDRAYDALREEAGR